MKYLSIVVAAMLVLLAAPLKAQSSQGSPDQASAAWHRGGGGQGSNHGDNGWQGRGNGGREGNRGRGSNGDRGRGWNRDDDRGRGGNGHWVWVKTRRPVLRFRCMRWFWEWVTDSHREWRWH